MNTKEIIRITEIDDNLCVNKLVVLEKGEMLSRRENLIKQGIRQRWIKMSVSEATELYQALQETKQKLELLTVEDLRILNADDRDELYEIIVFMDDRFASY